MRSLHLPLSLVVVTLCAAAIPTAAGDPLIARLLRDLEAADPATREAAARDLSTAEADDIAPALRRHVGNEEHAQTRLPLAMALACQGGKDGLQILVDALPTDARAQYWLCHVTDIDFGRTQEGLARWRSWAAEWPEAEFRREMAHRRRPPKSGWEGAGEFVEAAEILQQSGDRGKAAALFLGLAARHPRSDFAEDALELGHLLGAMAAEPPRTAAPPAQEAPLDVRIDAIVARLRDVNCTQTDWPGFCSVLEPGEETDDNKAALELRALGTAAFPRLLQLLDDRRPTRTVAGWQLDVPFRTVLRYQDVAVEILNALLPVALYRPSSTSSYLSSERADVRRRVIFELRAWVRESDGKTAVEALWLGTRHAGIYPTLDLLRLLATKHTQRKEVLEELGRMYDGGRSAIFRPAVCRLLIELGDRSRVEDVARRFDAGEFSNSWKEPDDLAAAVNARTWAREIVEQAQGRPAEGGK